MRILQINSVCGVGSTGRIATDIHNILSEKGHDSYIAYGRGVPFNCDNAIKIGTKYDNYTHLALTRVFDLHGFGSKKATLDFIKKVELLNPDVIHLHNIHGYYINIEILFDYLKKVNKPVIWTLHDCWAITGHCSHFDYIGCNKWKTECFDCLQKAEYPKSIVYDNSKKNFLNKKEIFTGVNNLTIVTPSNWLASLVKESILKEYPVKVINNGIDLSVFRPRETNFRQRYNLEEKYILLGVASNWGERKGLRYFLELSGKLKKDEIIVLVGLNKKQKEQLPTNILGITKTSNINELAEIYSGADVFINPTLEDNFPTVNIEAMACGTPIITFNTGGSIECVGEGCGYIASKGNIYELLTSIRKVRNNGKNKYIQNCVNRVESFYKKEEKYNNYLDLYKLVTGNRSKKSNL